jgi:hypothetical protein
MTNVFVWTFGDIIGIAALVAIIIAFAIALGAEAYNKWVKKHFK